MYTHYEVYTDDILSTSTSAESHQKLGNNYGIGFRARLSVSLVLGLATLVAEIASGSWRLLSRSRGLELGLGLGLRLARYYSTLSWRLYWKKKKKKIGLGLMFRVSDRIYGPCTVFLLLILLKVFRRSAVRNNKTLRHLLSCCVFYVDPYHNL